MTNPQEPTIAQAVPYDELVQMWKRAHSAHNSEYSIDWYKAGFRDAEACHGIATHPQVIDKVDVERYLFLRDQYVPDNGYDDIDHGMRVGGHRLDSAIDAARAAIAATGGNHV